MSEVTTAPPTETAQDSTKPLEKGGAALVILSGGQDSTTALFWAKERYGKVKAITFNYGQRHAVEIDAAKKVAKMADVEHEVVDVGEILVSSSPLTDKKAEVGQYDNTGALPGGVEPTFIPARNPLFITIAANRAAAEGIDVLVMGLCEADFGGYPDCRMKFVDAMAVAISEALHGVPNRFEIRCPLMFLNKGASVKFAQQLGSTCWEALSHTHTSYEGDYPPNPFNHASLLRARGFHDAGLPDPLIERAIKEGKVPEDYPPTGMVEGTRFGNRETWGEEIEEVLEAQGEGEEKPAKKKRKAKKSDE